MKRNTLLKGITVSVALSALLTGCGSTATTDNGTSNNNDDSTKAITLSGNAVDGYLQYATVCLDLSKDGYCQATEPSTQTDIDGKFSLEITPKIQENKNFDTAMLLVYGGKDVDTGDDFKGKLLSPKDGNIVNITPITTLVAKAVQKELKAHPELSKDQIKERIKSSKKRVAEALDLNEEDIVKDPVALQKAGNDKLIQKALELQKAVDALLVANDGLGNASHERAEEIYEALIDGLESMETSDKGIEKLLDRTFEQARKDDRVKDLLGGDRGLQLGDAAKGIARNIQAGFAGFDDEDRRKDDFLEKIASITKGDLKKVEIAFEEGKVGEIAGQITIDDGFFQPSFDWAGKFIKDDLAHVGIMNPSADLIEKIKALFNDGEKIKPGILFVKHERLLHAEDSELQEIGKQIKNFQEKMRAEKEKEEAQKIDQIIKIAPPMSLFMPEGRGYGKITFNSDNTLAFQKYRIQQDGTFAAESEEDQGEGTEYFYQDGKWVASASDSEVYTPQEDGGILLPLWNEKAYLVQGSDIAGKTRMFPQYNTEVAMSDDAQMYFIKIEKLKDVYQLHDQVYNYQDGQEQPYTSISDFIEGQCTTRWFEGDHNGGLAFAGVQTENGYSCDGSAKNGKLVFAHNNYANGGTTVGEEAGSWEVRTLDGGIDILVVKPYNMKRFLDDEGNVEYPIFAMKDGKLFRGNMEPEGLKRVMPVFNEAGMNSITETITKGWETIQQELPSFEDEYENQ